jgi:hypothetical protein
MAKFTTMGRFEPWVVLCLGSVCAVGRFVPWVFLSLGRFVPCAVLSLGRFVRVSFCDGSFLP